MVEAEVQRDSNFNNEELSYYQLFSWNKKLVYETESCVNGFLKCFIKDSSEQLPSDQALASDSFVE